MDEEKHKKFIANFGGVGDALMALVKFFIKTLEEIGDPELTKLWTDKIYQKGKQLQHEQEKYG